MAFSDEEYVAEQLQDKDATKSERDLGALKTLLLLLSKRTLSPRLRHTIVRERNIGGDALVWGSSTFGIWNSYNWFPNARAGMLLGDTYSATLGVSATLGSQESAYVDIRVVNPNRTWIDGFMGTRFKDTASTNATWVGDTTLTGTGWISITTGQTASSLTIFMNNETISSATLTASDSGSIVYQLSANTGNNWQTVTKGTELTFATTGQALRWRAYGTGSIDSIEIQY